MPDLKPANDSTASSRESPSAFQLAPKMQMSLMVYSKKDGIPQLTCPTFLPDAIYLCFRQP